MSTNPVMLPPGFAKLAANPLPTGSETAANTIGIVCVAACIAAVAGVVIATNTSGLARQAPLLATLCGTVRPSAFAVLRSIARSNWVGCSTGNSPGFVSLRNLIYKVDGLPNQSRDIWSGMT